MIFTQYFYVHLIMCVICFNNEKHFGLPISPNIVVESPSKISRPTVSKKKKKSLSKKRKTDSESANHSDDDVLVNWIRTFQIESALDSREDEWVKRNFCSFKTLQLLFVV